MPRMDLAFAQKILYGNSEVFVVPSTASYWLEWQEGFQTAVEQQLQQQLSTTGRDWTTGTELCMGLLPKAHLLWQSYSGRAYSMLKFAVLYMDASIVHSSYQCSGRQNTIHNDSCRWQSDWWDTTRGAFTVTKQSRLFSLITVQRIYHCQPRSTIYTSKKSRLHLQDVLYGDLKVV